MTRTKLPDEPWQNLSVDLMEQFPLGDFILIKFPVERGCVSNFFIYVAVDFYTRWFEYEIMKSVTSSKIIQSLDVMFTAVGLPVSIKSDNTSNFISHEF
jgi:hypothetical protein